jgi:class 3 adenylate cyclase
MSRSSCRLAPCSMSRTWIVGFVLTPGSPTPSSKRAPPSTSSSRTPLTGLSGTGLLALRRGQAIDFRLTGVLELERGHWRFVQTHLSVGLPNQDAVGLTFTTALEELAADVSAEHPFLGGMAAPDGTISIVFTDIQDSTALAEQLGDQRWVELLQWHHRGVVEATASRRGFVVKSLGDGFMLVFSSASDAVVCASQILAGVVEGWNGVPISIRAGINSGDAVRDVDDFYGHTVRVASRVAAAASGGEVLATRVVGELTRGRVFTWGPPRILELKGIKEPYEVRPLMATSAG